MRVKFKRGKEGDPIVHIYGQKIGVVERNSKLIPQVGEEWEVELRDTAPGERRGVNILRPVKRLEKWEVIAVGKVGEEKNPVARKISGDKILEEKQLEKRYVKSLTADSQCVGGTDIIRHEFEPILPEDIQVERPWLGWGLDDFESPRLSDEVVTKITKALLDAWRQGKPEASTSFSYQHKYGEIEVRWHGYSLSGFGTDGKPIANQNVAILKDGIWQWAEVRGVSYGYQNETCFAGGPAMVGIECGVKDQEGWLDWVDKLYIQEIEKIKAMPATSVALNDHDYYELTEDRGGQHDEVWAEQIKTRRIQWLEKKRLAIPEKTKAISAIYGSDVVLRYLPDIKLPAADYVSFILEKREKANQSEPGVLPEITPEEIKRPAGMELIYAPKTAGFTRCRCGGRIRSALFRLHEGVGRKRREYQTWKSFCPLALWIASERFTADFCLDFPYRLIVRSKQKAQLKQ